MKSLSGPVVEDSLDEEGEEMDDSLDEEGEEMVADDAKKGSIPILLVNHAKLEQ